MPLTVTMMMAVTADGYIARHGDHFPDWTGSADKRLFARVSREAGVLILGARTFATLPGPLPQRRHIVLTRTPECKPEHPDVVYTNEPPHRICRDLEMQGFSKAVLAGGAMINTLFAQAGMIDEVILTVAPRLFGKGVPVFNGPLDLKLTTGKVERLDESCLCIHYKVQADSC